ncbi:glutathione S-transferase [Delitschia confertaspora ATCC 74209]|uniref:Glutathione S-transferase n=1 Tax=Delitschia confertaspora ATCC 74209 TaxID=1513339 RepID=A0A9P4JT51_9PLEO|nr:glutathione S-transferase [Delitschia confertaspora ATCC 74209]
MPSLTLHHLQISQSERIPWLLEELSIPYTLQLYQRDPIFSPPSLKALHPMGASPVLEDATFNPSNPLILAESGAIAEYVIHKHGDGLLALPPNHPNYADYLYWFHFSNSALQPAILRRMTARRAVQSLEDPTFVMTSERLFQAIRHFDQRVSENTWLAGEEFTAADVMSVWCFTTVRKFEAFDLAEYPGVLAWLRRCTDRPAYRAAIGKCDPELDIEEGIRAEPPRRLASLGPARN